MSMKIYFFYIFLGVLYPVVKVVYYITGLVYLRGVIYGLIASVLTTCIGVLALKEYKGATKPVGHWLAALIPLIIIPLTPAIMVYNLGQGIFQIEKMTILVIFECIAITQIILAFLMSKDLKNKLRNG